MFIHHTLTARVLIFEKQRQKDRERPREKQRNRETERDQERNRETGRRTKIQTNKDTEIQAGERIIVKILLYAAQETGVFRKDRI